MNKVLITVPDLSRPGGVSSLYNILKLDALENISYFQIHGIKLKQSWARAIDLVVVFIKFLFALPGYKIVHVNPSFTSKSFLRDALFVFLARLFRRKVLVYWHGWDSDYAAKVKKSSLLKLFNATYAKAEISIVLGSVFAAELKDLGCQGEIFIESNAASDSFLSAPVSPKTIDHAKSVCFLFIARLEYTKGVYIAIDVISKLAEKFNVKLLIAGSGPELEKVQALIAGRGITNIDAVGYVGGAKKHDAFVTADALLLPTFHNEGMPISIIEAMLYGLPVISRSVGGIPDWVTEGENGYLIESKQPDDFVQVINLLLNSPAKFTAMSAVNIKKAKAFTPAAVTGRLQNYYTQLSKQ